MIRRVLRATAVAGTLSGVPSTLAAALAGGDVLAATRAAGQLVVPSTASRGTQVVAGALAHGVISFGWSAVLVATLPRRHRVAAGAAAGLGIAALDLGLAHRIAPAIAQLPRAPQVADHVAFGVLVALTTRPSR